MLLFLICLLLPPAPSTISFWPLLSFRIRSAAYSREVHSRMQTGTMLVLELSIRRINAARILADRPQANQWVVKVPNLYETLLPETVRRHCLDCQQANRIQWSSFSFQKTENCKTVSLCVHWWLSHQKWNGKLRLPCVNVGHPSLRTVMDVLS